MASELALALGIGCTWRSDGGRVYELSLCTWRTIALFERWVKDDAWRDVEETRADVSAEAYRQRRSLVTRLTIPLCYKGGAIFEDAWTSPEGVVYQTYLRALRHQPDVTVEQVRGWYDGPGAEDLVGRIAEMEQEQGEAPSVLVRKRRRPRKSKGEAPFRSTCAILVGEPWCLSLEQIGDLTPWQTNEIYFHERYGSDAGVRAGQVILPGSSPLGEESDAVAAMEAFVEAGKKRGLSDEQIEADWMARLTKLVGG